MKLSELKKLYIERLQEFPNLMFRLKTDFVQCKYIPGLQSYKQRHECVLAFEDGDGQALVDFEQN